MTTLKPVYFGHEIPVMFKADRLTQGDKKLKGDVYD